MGSDTDLDAIHATRARLREAHLRVNAGSGPVGAVLAPS